MSNKILTQLPIGKIKKFIEENFKEVTFSDKAEAFFKKEFLGDIANVDQLIALKDGDPKLIEIWLREEYGIDMELSGDYAIATVLSLLLEFEEEAFPKTISINDEEYKGGVHYVENRLKGFINKKEFTLYPLELKDPDFKMYISEKEVDQKYLNTPFLFKKTFQKSKPIRLTIPLAKFADQVDYEDVFNGSTMINKSNSKHYELNQIKTLTLLDLGLDKVEVEQIAVACFAVSSCSAPDMTESLTIKRDYYVYVTYKDRLVFGSLIEKADFLIEEQEEEQNNKYTLNPEPIINL